MKSKLLKYNLIPMLILFFVSMLYNIGMFLNGLMMEIKYQSGEYAYKTTGMNGHFFEELYGEEWSLFYMFWALIALSLIAAITILFYQKLLSKISYLLLSLSAIPARFIAVIFVSQSEILLTVGLITEIVYTLLTVIFSMKDFINWNEKQKGTCILSDGIIGKSKLSLLVVLILFSAGSLYYLGRILFGFDSFAFLEAIYEYMFPIGYLVAEVLLLAAGGLVILFLKDKVSYAAISMLLLGTVIPNFFMISLIGNPSGVGLVIRFVMYALFVFATLLAAFKDIKRLEKSC